MLLNSSRVNMGIIFMLIAMFMFSCLNVIVKDVTQNYPVWEVVFFRVFFVLPLLFYMAQRHGGLPKLKRAQLQGLIFMSVVGACGIYCLFMAFRLIPLADATALAYSSILFITALSAPILKENVGIYRWCAIAAGFIGVVIMANPKGQLDFYCCYALGFALMDAVMVMIIRLLSPHLSASAIVFYFSLFASILSGCMMLFEWRLPSFTDFLILVSMSIGSGIAQLLLTTAYRLAPAVVVAPMNYSSMIVCFLDLCSLMNDPPCNSG